jgi:ABC-type uncharacterized transport system involved in gliding motility auxiliary subunit
MRFADSFRAARWVRLINLLLQAILFLSLFAGLNYIALHHTWRFDLTRTHRQSLSAETRSYLEGLGQPVRIIVTLTDDSENTEVAQAYRDVSALLREYAYVTSGNDRGRVTVEYLDVYTDRKKAEELGVDQPNIVLLLSGDHHRVLSMQDLYTIKNKTTREAFKGESALTAAILDVSSPEKKRIYFLQGHGELSLDEVNPRGLSLLRDELRQQNFDLVSIDLAQNHKVPDDASLVIIAGPQGRYRPFEEELLRNYLQTRAGRAIVMVDPQRSLGLENLFFDWGIVVYDDIIYDNNPQEIDEAGNLRLRHYLPHPITDILINNGLPVIVGPARVVSEDRGRASDDGLMVKILIASSDTAWGETGYRLGTPPVYTPGEDLRGKLGVLVVSERVKPANLPLSVKGGRLAVFGTSDLVTNNRIINQGNLDVFLATVNWCVDRDTQLNIPPRPVQNIQLSLSQQELLYLRLGLFLVVPGIVGLLGLVVHWTRRR